MRVLWFVLLLFLPFQQEVIRGKVVRIIDGDSIVVLVNENEQLKVRLEGIDCPEKRQDFGQRATRATAELCFGKEVVIQKTGVDRYRRTLGYVYAGDVCINKELLRRGLAWHFKKYNQEPELAGLEITARHEKVGLWSQPNPVPPWEFRKQKKSGGK